jgi:hypothetical protein
MKNGDVLIVGGGIPDFEEDILGAPLLFRATANAYVEINVSNELVNRSDHAAVSLPGGEVLLTGGRTAQATATDDVVIYDSATRQFR